MRKLVALLYNISNLCNLYYIEKLIDSPYIISNKVGFHLEADPHHCFYISWKLDADEYIESAMIENHSIIYFIFFLYSIYSSSSLSYYVLYYRREMKWILDFSFKYLQCP